MGAEPVECFAWALILLFWFLLCSPEMCFAVRASINQYFLATGRGLASRIFWVLSFVVSRNDPSTVGPCTQSTFNWC